jgi:hypothetical protein
MIHLCIHTADLSEVYVLRKEQFGLTSTESLRERWNININENKIQTIYFSHLRRLVEAYLTLKGRNTPFVNNVTYLHTEMIAKDFRKMIRIYPLLKGDSLKLQYEINTVQSIDKDHNDIYPPRIGICGSQPSFETTEPKK